MQCLQGRPFLHSASIAYAPQTAWLLNATVRDNIIFGSEFDSVKYNAVIRACALTRDLENLDGGDLTEIGEKGVNISGGQKQRISLARACYSNASIVLLDDPLSAVDAPTARHLLEHCILKLLKGRTVILVSHAIQLVLPYATHVILMDRGAVLLQGTPSSVLQKPTCDILKGISLEKEISTSQSVHVSGTTEKSIVSNEVGRKLVKKETQAIGAVKRTVYFSYYNAIGGFFYLIVFLSSFMLTWGSKLANDWWLKNWTDNNENYYQSFVKFESNYLNFDPGITFGTDAKNNSYYITIYALCGLLIIVAANIQTIIVLFGSLCASRRMHNNMLKSVFYSPLRFFETTPVGRILNRFSKDIESIDSYVASSIKSFVDRIIQSMVILTLIGSITPIFLVVVPILVVIYIYFASRYLNVSRELKRFDSTTKSPIYTQFSETLAGVSTIRAYCQEDRFIEINRRKVDSNHMPYFFVWAANRWLCIRTDMLSASVVFFSGVSIVFWGIEAGWAALVINYSLEFTDALLWAIRMHAEMEIGMNAGNENTNFSGKNSRVCKYKTGTTSDYRELSTS
jgi:ABC-type multidrug transport system fused ATPase/permease subunit